MLSYRHAFHAGNHADVLKHFVLYLVLDYFNRKDKPYWYIDTHAGAGIYDWRGDQAQKVGEYRSGAARLYAAGALPDDLAEFAAHIKTMLPENLYGGSPWLAQSMMRRGDRMRLFELHPADFALLSDNMRQSAVGRRVSVKQEDGFAALETVLPPPPRRAVVLIDPPYEQKQDYARTVAAVKESLRRFAQGCYLVWYPCLSREESRMLPESLIRLCPDNYLHVRLQVHAPRADGFGMHGSGMFVANPPYLLHRQLAQTLPELTRLLAQDTAADFGLDSRIR